MKVRKGNWGALKIDDLKLFLSEDDLLPNCKIKLEREGEIEFDPECFVNPDEASDKIEKQIKNSRGIIDLYVEDLIYEDADLDKVKRIIEKELDNIQKLKKIKEELVW